MTMNAQNNNLKIRTASEKDLEAVAAIEESCFSTPWSIVSFATCLGQNHIHFQTADWKEEVAGFSILYISVDQAELANIAVSELYRGNGIAECLIWANIDYSSKMGVKDIFLEVRESNIAAFRLYKKMGFTEIGLRKGFYEKPREDAILMKLELPVKQES